MGYLVNLKTNNSILAKEHATDGSVSKSIPTKDTNSVITFIFPDNVVTITTLFIKNFFSKELESCKTEEEFYGKYKIIVSRPKAQEILSNIIRNYYSTKRK